MRDGSFKIAVGKSFFSTHSAEKRSQNAVGHFQKLLDNQLKEVVFTSSLAHDYGLFRVFLNSLPLYTLLSIREQVVAVSVVATAAVAAVAVAVAVAVNLVVVMW